MATTTELTIPNKWWTRPRIPHEFWSVSIPKWNALVRAYLHAPTTNQKRSAYTQIYRFAIAAEHMENGMGEDVLVACDRCVKHGYECKGRVNKSFKTSGRVQCFSCWFARPGTGCNMVAVPAGGDGEEDDAEEDEEDEEEEEEAVEGEEGVQIGGTGVDGGDGAMDGVGESMGEDTRAFYEKAELSLSVVSRLIVRLRIVKWVGEMAGIDPTVIAEQVDVFATRREKLVQELSDLRAMAGPNDDRFSEPEEELGWKLSVLEGQVRYLQTRVHELTERALDACG